ncbi:uncharacterized protein PODANS_1_10920, partial [Podospora anserina S mat+]
MSAEPPVPETRVLAIASHANGFERSFLATFTMQSLGCDVAALNTVDFSNHTGYGQWTGTRSTPEHILDLWSGLKQSFLDDFDMMLSGYVPGAEALGAVGRIAEELKSRAEGRFFWVLDPVMGDNGNLYVGGDVVPVYREVKITDMLSLGKAIEVLHSRYGVPHIVITSLSLPDDTDPDTPGNKKTLSVVGSSMTSTKQPRAFKISFPAIDCYFSGTGDMFAALMVVRMREAVCDASTSTEPGLDTRRSWLSEDGVGALELPLARAAERVLGSMHEVLAKTAEGLEGRLEQMATGVCIPIRPRLIPFVFCAPPGAGRASR